MFHRVPHFVGKDGRTKWRKHVGKQRIRIRRENIIKVKISGERGEAQTKTTASEIWNCFLRKRFYGKSMIVRMSLLKCVPIITITDLQIKLIF